MDLFQTWLSSVVSPERYGKTYELILTLQTVQPKGIEGVLENITSKLNAEPTYHLLFLLEQGLADCIAYALQQYEFIVVDDIEKQDLNVLGDFVDTISRIEEHAMPGELLDRLRAAESVEDKLLAVAGTYYSTEDRLLELFTYTNPAYFHALESRLQERLLSVEEVSVQAELSGFAKAFLAELPEQHPLRHYVQRGGVVGYPFQAYLTTFESLLGQTGSPQEQGALWFGLGALACLEKEQIPLTVKQYLQNYYTDANRLNLVYRTVVRYSQAQE
jgi:hypothetical protein